jgi:hypothetical protein
MAQIIEFPTRSRATTVTTPDDDADAARSESGWLAARSSERADLRHRGM